MGRPAASDKTQVRPPHRHAADAKPAVGGLWPETGAPRSLALTADRDQAATVSERIRLLTVSSARRQGPASSSMHSTTPVASAGGSAKDAFTPARAAEPDVSRHQLTQPGSLRQLIVRVRFPSLAPSG